MRVAAPSASADEMLNVCCATRPRPHSAQSPFTARVRLMVSVVREPAAGISRRDLAPEVLIWADDVHRKKEASLLSFWRLSFSPDYQQTEIFNSLSNFYGDCSGRD